MCARQFEEERPIRIKFLVVFLALFVMIFLLAFVGTFSFTNLWCIFSICFGMLHVQIRYVFDFDPPDKEEKKSDSKLTDLVQKQLDKLFKQFMPSPV